jgi:IS30 family transposase
MMRGPATARVITTLKRYGPLPVPLIARKAKCKVATAQATLNRLVYDGLLSFVEVRLGRFARPRGRIGSRRLLRLYYIPKIHSNNRVYQTIRRLVIFKRPVNVYERRAFGMWLSSSILPSQVRESIITSVFEHKHRAAHVRD